MIRSFVLNAVPWLAIALWCDLGPDGFENTVGVMSLWLLVANGIYVVRAIDADIARHAK